MSDPFAIVALTGIGINIASSLSEKIASRWLKKPLQDADGRMSGLLKTLKIVPETFNDKLQKCLKQAVEIYFDEHPQYKITGIVRFLQSDAVQAHVAGYFIADPVVESDVVSDTLDEIFHLSAVGHILAQRRGIDFEKILPDFLDACEKALLSHTDEPELLLVYINFNHARNIQNTIRSEAQRVVEHVDERFEGFERKRSATPVNDLFLYTGWAETITDDAEESVSHLRRAFNAGMTEQVNVELHRLKEAKRWSGIKENTKARILAFEASLVLQQNDDFDGALQLLNEARKHEIVDEISAIHALILYKRESPEAALDFLQDQQDRRSQNIKLSILIGLQRYVSRTLRQLRDLL